MRVAAGVLRTADSAEGDCLEFYIDGECKDAIDGSVDEPICVIEATASPVTESADLAPFAGMDAAG